MMYRLIVVSGPLIGQRLTVERAPMTLGRDPDCTVHIPDEEVARKHAVLEHRPEGLFIRDLGSMNRILVNHREVRDARLRHGDEVELGRTRFLVQALIQADVAGIRRRKRAKRLVSAVVALMIAGGMYAAVRWWGRERDRRVVPLQQTSEGLAVQVGESSLTPTTVLHKASALATDEQSTVLADDIRMLRADLVDVQESVRKLATRTLSTTNQAAASRPQKPVPEAVSVTPTPASLKTPAPETSARVLPPEAMPGWLARGTASAPAVARAPASATPPTPAPTSPPAPLSRIRIASLDQHKFQEREEFDEMRVVNVELQCAGAPRNVDPSALRVEVAFFDQDAASGAIAPTRAIVSVPQLKAADVAGKWDRNQTVTATYVVPKGMRLRESGMGRREHYYGYLVRVFHKDALLDQDSRPHTLLEAAETGAGASSAMAGPRLAP